MRFENRQIEDMEPGCRANSGSMVVPALNRFQSWKELVFTSLTETGILLAAGFGAWRLHQACRCSALESFLAFYLFAQVITLLVLKVLRTFYPPREGIHRTDSTQYYVYSLSGFLLIVNMNLVYFNRVIPPPLCKFFYRLLGARMGKGILPVGGYIADPHGLIRVEEDAIIGWDALLLPHAHVTVQGRDLLVLGRIEIGKGAIIGARSVIMPGVTVGENAMINVMSLVPMNTVIPPGETWGGNPARKICEDRRHA
jgi:hypothetical protein